MAQISLEACAAVEAGLGDCAALESTMATAAKKTTTTNVTDTFPGNFAFSEITLEGLPGAGKSTMLTSLVEKFSDKYRVYVNGGRVGGRELPEEFTQQRYDKTINEAKLLTTSSICLKLAYSRVDLIALMKAEAPGGRLAENNGRPVLHIQERDALSALHVFFPGAIYDIGAPAVETDVLAEHMEGAIDAILGATRPAASAILYLDASADAALKRVERRGRKFESDRITIDYMVFLRDRYEGLLEASEKVVRVDVGERPADAPVDDIVMMLEDMLSK